MVWHTLLTTIQQDLYLQLHPIYQDWNVLPQLISPLYIFATATAQSPAPVPVPSFCGWLVIVFVKVYFTFKALQFTHHTFWNIPVFILRWWRSWVHLIIHRHGNSYVRKYAACRKVGMDSVLLRNLGSFGTCKDKIWRRKKEEAWGTKRNDPRGEGITQIKLRKNASLNELLL